MKRKTLLLLVMISFITELTAQKKTQRLTGFAITSQEIGGKSWKEVRLLDMKTGQELKSVYKSSGEIEVLNARTGKPVQLKDNAQANKPTGKKIVNLDKELEKVTLGEAGMYSRDTRRKLYQLKPGELGPGLYVENTGKHEISARNTRTLVYAPFATNSAAMAYDKKHERLYYTPMGINQLRYIDISSKSPKLYYFEDEPFGLVAGMHDICNQVTRMVIAADGNGYALSNDAKHLLRFTTGKKPIISDLGSVADDPQNEMTSVHDRNGYGGDMIADALGNLYLFTASRRVFKINIESRIATFKGTIKGLPAGFTTNGAMVESGGKIIVASSQSTAGYYRVDIQTLQAEKISTQDQVYNASDLANSNIAFDKKKRKNGIPKESEEPRLESGVADASRQKPIEVPMTRSGISIYPNPALSNSFVKISFDEQPEGKYRVELIDLAGRTIRAQEVNIQSRQQVMEYAVPEIAKGNYLVKIANDANKVAFVSKLVIR